MKRLMPYQDGLCRPLDPFTRYDVVHTRQFPDNNLAISIRPLYLERDIALLRNWVKREYVRPWWKHDTPFNEIIQTLIHTAHSDFAQVFTGMNINQPLCEVEVFRALQDDELGMSNLTRPGDYVLRLLPSHIVPAQQLAVVQTCVEYFLLHGEVKRILALVDEEDEHDNKLIRKAGFSFLEKIATPYKMDNLYVYP